MVPLKIRSIEVRPMNDNKLIIFDYIFVIAICKNLQTFRSAISNIKLIILSNTKDKHTTIYLL